MNAMQMYAELIRLRNNAGEVLYKRLKIARDLLADREWVQSPEQGGGDEAQAIDRLEEFCFAEVCGALSLSQMLEILREVPQQAAWKANKYNLRAMYAEMRARRVPAAVLEPQHQQRGTNAQIEQLKTKIQELMEENKQLRKDKKELQTRLDRIHKVLGIDQEAA